MKNVKVAIIGAGSAGLSALRQVQQQTDNYVLIDQTPLGTKCARTGCMPSKALLIAANDFHRRRVFEQAGIRGADGLTVDIPAVLRQVRRLRDRFTEGMIETTRRLAGDRLITARAQITAPDRIRIGNEDIAAEAVIIAAGSRPLVPGPWRQYGDRILTSDTLFEQPDLPGRIAVVGLGPIGLEIGQALARLGLAVTGFDMKPTIGAITDPAVSDRALGLFNDELPLCLNAPAKLTEPNGALRITHPDKDVTVDAVLAAMGVVPAVDGLGLENLGVQLDERGLPPYNPRTMQVADVPVFIAGDVNGCRPILHEALDEGYVAGHNAVNGKTDCYCRRTALGVVFSDPQIAAAGLRYEQLKNSGREFVTGSADFAEQSRAILETHNRGLLQVYADRQTAQLLGAEMVIPDAEHLAHQLAFALQHQHTVFDMLQAPFYHPTLEEGLRSALKNAAHQLPQKADPLTLCEPCPESPLC